jgi:hypothetical protein
MFLKTRNRLSFRILRSLLTIITVLLVVQAKPVFAEPDILDPLFATTTGIDIVCSQSYPCNLTTAVFLAADNQYVYVAGGTYTGTMDPMLTINKDIRLTGGWNGASSGPLVVDPVAYPTILDGEDTRRIIAVLDMATPIISGFTITRGYNALRGGGIEIDVSPLVQILNNIFYDNYAVSYGGGLYIGEGNIEIKGCRFEANSVDYGGGGLMLANGVSATMTENTFTGNSSSYGAALHTDNASLTFYDNYVVNNLWSDTYTSAISLLGTTGLTAHFYNNIIAGNMGDGIKVQSMTLNMYHNTIADNGRDGLNIYSEGHVVLTNNIFSGHNGGGDNSIYKVASGVIDSSTHNLFWDNTIDSYTGSNPVLGDPKFYGIYHILPNSAARDAGTSSFITWDIDNQARSDGGIPDIGADETLPVYLPSVFK